jgi:glycosyltransferase involved in cell wall biosynthesis
MKIAYMLGSLNRGGTETLLLDLFSHKELLPDCICIYRSSGVLENDFIQTGVKIKKIAANSNWFSYLKELRMCLKKEKINLIHAQQPIDAFFALLATVGLSVRTILTLHGYDFHGGFLAKLILFFSLKLTRANIYVSNHVKNYYTKKYKLYRKKQFVVYNGINLKKIQSVAHNDTLRSELGIDEETILMGMVGNFVPVRDHMTVCRFANTLKEQGSNFHIVFIGKKTDAFPELFDSCFQYCQQNNLLHHVSFLGSRDNVPQLLAQLDLFVYATDYDTFGIAIVEAMVAGIPVLVNDWEVMYEISEHGKYVTLYSTKDVNSLLNQFEFVIKNKDAFRVKTIMAKQYAKERFSIENHITSLLSVYDKVIYSKK